MSDDELTVEQATARLHEAWQGRIRELGAERDALAAEVEQLREALKFYTDRDEQRLASAQASADSNRTYRPDR